MYNRACLTVYSVYGIFIKVVSADFMLRFVYFKGGDLL